MEGSVLNRLALSVVSTGRDLDKLREQLINEPKVAQREQEQYTILHIAASHNCIPLLKVGIECGVHRLPWFQNQDVVHMVLSTGSSEEFFKELLSLNVDLEGLDHGLSPLARCINLNTDRSSLNHAKALIEAGARVNSRDLDEWTPLHHAASVGRGDCVSLLVENKADLHGQASWTMSTPLHLAAVNGHADVTAMLLKAGADPTITKRGGDTPLHVAAMFGRTECVKALLQYGAPVGCLNELQETPEDVARDEAKILLQTAGNQCWTPKEHEIFGPECSETIATVLLAANRSEVDLPPELWSMVFKHFQRRAFA